MLPAVSSPRHPVGAAELVAAGTGDIVCTRRRFRAMAESPGICGVSGEPRSLAVSTPNPSGLLTPESRRPTEAFANEPGLLVEVDRDLRRDLGAALLSSSLADGNDSCFATENKQTRRHHNRHAACA